MTEFEERALVLLERIARDQTTTKELIGNFVFAMVEEAEQEIPEKMRRFMNYFHDLHDVRYMYESLGQAIPPYINREMERCDDRYRQLLTKQHAGGAFEKIRREMATDPLNRWDHTKFLERPKESGNEAGKSE